MRKILAIFIGVLVLSARPLTVPNIFYTGFEDGDRTAGGKLNLNNTGLSCTVDGMQVSATFARVGSKSIHSICRYADPLCGSSHRDEWALFKNNADSTVKESKFNFSLYLDGLYPGGVVDGDDFLVMQFKSTSQDIFPFVAIWVMKDASGLFSNYVLQIQTASTAGAAVKETTTTRILGRAYSNTWVDFSLDIDWQWDATGQTDVYMDGVLKTSVTGRNMNPPWNVAAPRYPSFRCGLYCFGWNNGPDVVTRRDAYYDEIKIGNTGSIAEYFVTEPKPSSAPTKTLNLPIFFKKL